MSLSEGIGYYLGGGGGVGVEKPTSDENGMDGATVSAMGKPDRKFLTTRGPTCNAASLGPSNPAASKLTLV